LAGLLQTWTSTCGRMVGDSKVIQLNIVRIDIGKSAYGEQSLRSPQARLSGLTLGMVLLIG
jgi:hypothetical protein